MKRPATSETRTREGYLLLADISGYTAFLTGTELEHAQEIIHELTTLIREKLCPPMRFVKLEGDAVFCYAEALAFRDGERFVELIEACYFAFSNRLQDMERSTICRCDACAAIPTLGLKFIAHFGSFVVEREGGSEDLAGADVILAHRLLKNSVTEGGGPEAYALFTDACLQKLPPELALPGHAETIDAFGEVKAGVQDLKPALAAMREQRHVYISAEEADIETVFELPVPPSIAWRYYVDPVERQRWICRQYDINPDEATPNPAGRTGVGAKSHCGHGPGPVQSFREVVDWRPFEYFTTRAMTPLGGAFVRQQPVAETLEFTPLGENKTRIISRFRIINRSRLSLLAFRVAKPWFARLLRRAGPALQSVIEEDRAKLSLDES